MKVPKVTHHVGICAPCSCQECESHTQASCFPHKNLIPHCCPQNQCTFRHSIEFHSLRPRKTDQITSPALAVGRFARSDRAIGKELDTRLFLTRADLLTNLRVRGWQLFPHSLVHARRPSRKTTATDTASSSQCRKC